GYTTKELIFKWRHDNPFTVETDMAIPRFMLHKATTNDSCVKSFITGDFSCAIVNFHLSRQMQSYILQVYIPSILLVVISWLSFWIDARAAPARVALGITTVLTVTTMTAGIQETLPAVTYAKAIDIWMAMCLCFVFLCLFEYALANYFLVLEEERRTKQQDAPVYVTKLTNRQRGDDKNNQDNGNNYELQACHHQNEVQESKIVTRPVNDIRFKRFRNITARHLDYSARIIFPLLFAIFNLLYWPTYLSKDCI
ncbi:glycine receptor subunit alpha-2-like, partial [Anneissia japonica]|uniref:glycine receptor subunit alpha-2-like n=1 Tax=Anneissia japonica TaxID=1529436 RepID=UPI0014256675